MSYIVLQLELKIEEQTQVQKNLDIAVIANC
jgi:hypothetical protein